MLLELHLETLEYNLAIFLQHFFINIKCITYFRVLQHVFLIMLRIGLTVEMRVYDFSVFIFLLYFSIYFFI